MRRCAPRLASTSPPEAERSSLAVSRELRALKPLAPDPEHLTLNPEDRLRLPEPERGERERNDRSPRSLRRPSKEGDRVITEDGEAAAIGGEVSRGDACSRGRMRGADLRDRDRLERER